ncbi:MAG: hypothetical protein M3237_03965 [Actinomycetota bacterium]|nr:hypothetical protein [Actinomycetota bacterium]
MTWHTVTVPADELSLLLVAVGCGGGIVTGSHPCADGVSVTYVMHPS